MVRGTSVHGELLVALPPGALVSIVSAVLPARAPACLPIDPLVLLEVSITARLDLPVLGTGAIAVDDTGHVHALGANGHDGLAGVSDSDLDDLDDLDAAGPTDDDVPAEPSPAWLPPEPARTVPADGTWRLPVDGRIDLDSGDIAGLALQHAPAAIIATDVDGYVTLWNAAAAHLFDWPERDVLGRPDPTRRDDDRWRLRDDVQRVLGGVPLPPRRARFTCRDGRVLTAQVTPVPLIDSLSVLRGMLTVVTDPAAALNGEADTDAIADERARARRKIERSQQRHSAIGSLGRRALHNADPEALLNDAVRTISEILDAPMVTLVHRHPEGRLEVLASRGWAPPPGIDPIADHPRTPAAIALASGMPVILDDLATALPEEQRAMLGEDDVRSGLAVPVGTPTRPWGVLTALFSEPGASADLEAIGFVQGVADVIGAAQARRRSEAEMRHRAWHDALTDLPNRDLFHERLTQALALGRRNGVRTALLLLDLDGFKDVNDSQGHQAGDQVLRQVAHRLRTTAAAGLIGLTGPVTLPDGPTTTPSSHAPLADGVTVARLGGDEFAVIVADLDSSRGSMATATSAAEAVIASLREPFASPGGSVSLGGSVGIVIAPDHGDEPYALLRRADMAMYRAKRERLGHAVHDPAIDEDAESRLWMVNDLRAALADGQVQVAYQPVVDLGRHEVSSVEALARWTHHDRGPQAPTEFVALAEQAGLVAELTELVVRGAVTQCAEWLRQGRYLPTAVNLSAVVLGSVNYAAHLRAILADADLPPTMLKVEVTESTLASDTAVAALREIGAMGVHVAIDDFGTGYSSLGRLKQLPVRILKIDKSFVTGLTEDRRDVAIVRCVVALAEELGLHVVAEGVETVDVARRLRQLGVHRAQGFLYSVPASAPLIEEWHDNWMRGICPCCAPDAAPPLPLPPLLTDLSDDFDDAGFDGLDGLAQGPSWDAPSS